MLTTITLISFGILAAVVLNALIKFFFPLILLIVGFFTLLMVV